LVEGSGSKEYEHFRAFMRAEPAAMHTLLEKLADLTVVYLRMQIESGAQVIQLFDSWAGLHDLSAYREFALPYNQRIMQAAGDMGATRIYFALGASHLLEAIGEIPAEGVGVDWRTDLHAARAALPGRALQGNLDPAVLFADRETIAMGARRVLDRGLGGPHIFNLGHGIWPATPVDAVAHLVETVREYVRS
jgi:uroporphyrinogen decarboxylase